MININTCSHTIPASHSHAHLDLCRSLLKAEGSDSQIWSFRLWRIRTTGIRLDRGTLSRRIYLVWPRHRGRGWISRVLSIWSTIRIVTVSIVMDSSNHLSEVSMIGREGMVRVHMLQEPIEGMTLKFFFQSESRWYVSGFHMLSSRDYFPVEIHVLIRPYLWSTLQISPDRNMNCKRISYLGKSESVYESRVVLRYYSTGYAMRRHGPIDMAHVTARRLHHRPPAAPKSENC